MALAQQIAERDPFALKFAKASVNEMQNAQGWRAAMEGAFKNYMLTIPHRIEMGTYGPGAREEPEGSLRGPQQEGRAKHDLTCPSILVLHLLGDAEQSVQTLAIAAAHQKDESKALSLYYRGAILNRLGRYEEARASLDEALAERDNLILARQEKGESLWQLGRREEAVSVWSDAVQRNSRLALVTTSLPARHVSQATPNKRVSTKSKRTNSLLTIRFTIGCSRRAFRIWG